jgi:hypothetical protein
VRLQLLRGEAERCVIFLDNVEKLTKLHSNVLQVFARLGELVSTAFLHVLTWSLSLILLYDNTQNIDGLPRHGGVCEHTCLGKASQRLWWRRATSCAFPSVHQGRGLFACFLFVELNDRCLIFMVVEGLCRPGRRLPKRRIQEPFQ